MKPKIYFFKDANNHNNCRKTDKPKTGVYFWGFTLTDNPEIPEKAEEFALIYVGKSQKNIYERLMQEFSQLIFGGFGTIFSKEYLKENNFKYFLNKINQHPNNNEYKEQVIYSVQCMKDLANFHLGNNKALNEHLKWMKDRLCYTYIEVDASECAIVEKIIHNVVRPHVLGLGRISTSLNGKKNKRSKVLWEEIKEKYKTELHKVISDWIDSVIKNIE
jgi:hypothetical protein